MKALKWPTRILPIFRVKLERILGYPTSREILESLAVLIEDNPYVRNKMIQAIETRRLQNESPKKAV